MKESDITFYSEQFSECAAASIQEILLRIEEQKQGSINIALSGGSTPMPVLDVLRSSKLDWKRYNFFLVDERCVPESSENSNFGNIKKVFFDHIKEARSFPFYREGKRLEEMPKIYEDEIKNHTSKNAHSIPEFDLILLGMGTDGHTASLFPGSASLNDEKLVSLNLIPSKQEYRLTFNYSLILAAKEIVILIKGEEKNNIVHQILNAAETTYPIDKVIRLHDNMKCITG